ncbi:hypothetical protein MVEG_01644 [Podila verticillata NRRL 6337]|nr:hypothetical protein MVEG_01644 [Podila verticillata NRRL 6337]
METFPLPLECLQLIVHQLALRKELRTLSSLLRVSKYVCLVSLPYIYSDPFHWFDESLHFRIINSRSYSFGYIAPVVQLLLASVPSESLTGLIKAMYELPEDTSAAATTDLSPPKPQHWRINYLSFVRHFHSQERTSCSFLADLSEYSPLEPRLKAYVDEHQLAEKYNAFMAPFEGILRFPRTSSERSAQLETPSTIAHLRMEIHREATWILCQPVLEQLQSIAIPLSDIERYLESIARFPSLNSVTFKLDELADIPTSAQDTSQEAHQQLKHMQEKRLRDLESAIQFVQIHTTMFRGTLRHVYAHKDWCWFGYAQTCPDSFLNRMLELLPTLINPTELTSKNWKHFVAKVEQTNLEHVRMISVQDGSAYWYEQLKSKPFLHRCPSLRTYNTISLGPESFKWASERVGLRQRKDNTTTISPLEEISIHALKEPFGNELDDIGVGFEATLKSFKIEGHSRAPGSHPLLTIGHGWKMPVLTTLSANMHSETLVVDPDFLRHCPSLKALSLKDYCAMDNVDEIRLGHPAQLPDLAKLRWDGSHAVSFHPDTLHSTKDLKLLILGSPSFAMEHALPPTASDLDGNPIDRFKVSRTHWTWDWYLPHLTVLDFAGAFALCFQFKMLQGTPSLQELTLSIYSNEDPVRRVLTELDFILEETLGHELTDDLETETMNFSVGDSSRKEPKVYSLHTESLRDLGLIHYYLIQMERRIKEPRATPLFPGLEGAPPPDIEQRLTTYRQQCMMRRPVQHDRRFRGFEMAPVIQPVVQERLDSQIRNIEEILERTPELKPSLEILFENIARNEHKKEQEAEWLRQFRAAHPERLVVPSVKKLSLYGRWSLSEEVLETMLGQVFRNVESIDEFLSEGYSMSGMVRVTQAMPWLKRYHSVRYFDPETCQGDYKLKQFTEYPIAPFEYDAANRVLYECYLGASYVRDTNAPLDTIAQFDTRST